jgi:hypothetical protein
LEQDSEGERKGGERRSRGLEQGIGTGEREKKKWDVIGTEMRTSGYKV